MESPYPIQVEGTFNQVSDLEGFLDNDCKKYDLGILGVVEERVLYPTIALNELMMSREIDEMDKFGSHFLIYLSNNRNSLESMLGKMKLNLGDKEDIKGFQSISERNNGGLPSAKAYISRQIVIEFDGVEYDLKIKRKILECTNGLLSPESENFICYSQGGLEESNPFIFMEKFSEYILNKNDDLQKVAVSQIAEEAQEPKT